MKKILALFLALAAGPALAADNIPVTAGSGTPIRSTDTSVGATGAGPYVNWYTLSTSGAAGTAPTVLYSAAGTSISNALGIQGVTGGVAVPVSGTITANQGSPPWTVNPGTAANWALAATGTSVPANAILVGMSQSGTLTALTGASGSLNVFCTGGCTGGGGTSLTDQAAFTQTSTSITPIGCLFINSYAAITTGHAGVVSCTNAGSMNVNVTNASSPGRQTSSLSSPVVPSAASTHFHLIATGTGGDAQNIKASPATLLSCQLGNNSTSTIAYLKIFNKASTPTLGTDTPYKTIIIPAPNAGGGGNNPNFGPGGIALSLGFGIAVVTGIADNSSTGVSATTVSVDCDYE